MTPFFSVIVPVYRVEKYLRECVDSILAQTFSDFELLLVDDGSPDGCPAICDKYAEADERVIVIHQQNAGVTAARRAGLERGSAEYAVFVDSDDWLADTYLAVIHRAITENGGIRPDMVVYSYAQAYETKIEPDPIALEAGLYDKKRLTEEVYPYMLSDPRQGSFTARLLYGHLTPARRELYLAHWLTDPLITTYEDACIKYEVLYASDHVYVCDEPYLYYYRIHGASNLSSYKPDFLRTIDRCGAYLREHLGGRSPEIDRGIERFIGAQTMIAVWDEFRHGYTAAQAARHVREKLRGTSLIGHLDTGSFPAAQKCWFLFLKLRLYFPLMLLTSLWIKMSGRGSESRTESL